MARDIVVQLRYRSGIAAADNDVSTPHTTGRMAALTNPILLT